MHKRFLALAVICTLTAACNSQSSSPMAIPPASLPVASSAPVGGNAINELPEPPVVHAVHGVAEVPLVAHMSPLTGLPTFEFDGMDATMPTVNVKPGETMSFDVTDNLPRGGMVSFINLHFHGMGSSPLAPGDDVLGMFTKPGHSIHYTIHVPRNQSPGLYWYHPHIHGQVNFQVGSSGMSGAIVVEGLARHIPQLAQMKQRLIVVRDTGVGKDAVPAGSDEAMSDMASIQPRILNNNPCGPEIGFTLTLNGIIQPTITIAPGEQQFFRLVNATGHKTMKLAVDGGSLELVAIDGFALDTNPKNPPTETLPYIIVPPAARAEFVVTGPSHGSTIFRTKCYDTGSGGDRDPDEVLAKIRPPRTHGGTRAAVAKPLTAGAPLPANWYTLPLPQIAAHRTVVFSEGPKHFTINGQTFSINAPPMYVVHTGTVEEWHVVNNTTEVHDFHIHQIHFLVEKVDGKKLEHPYWADSVVIPHRRGDGSNGSIDLLMNFRDPVIKGMFVFHCHILDHEDAGMMAKIQAI
jgi:FtsP/CotA-like multicopper oxidase with cupredoxin domain